MTDSKFEIQIVIPKKQPILSGSEWLDCPPIGADAWTYARRLLDAVSEVSGILIKAFE